MDKEDIEKYKELQEQQKKLKSEQPSPAIDVYEENLRLKNEIDLLKKQIEKLKAGNLKQEVKPENKEVLGTAADLDIVDSLKKNELIELCKDAGYPQEEWMNLKIDDLKSYIKGKI
jgi:cell division protein FtsB